MNEPQGSVVTAVIETWKKFGVFDFILPFLLVFAIIYGILEQTKLFGDEAGKSVNAIIAFAIAMTTTLTGWFLSFLTGFLPWVSTISIVIITGLMLVAIFVKDFDTLTKNDKLLKVGAGIVVISIGAVLISLGSPILEELDPEKLLAGLGLTVMDIWGIVFFIGFIVALWAIGKGGTSSGE